MKRSFTLMIFTLCLVFLTSCSKNVENQTPYFEEKDIDVLYEIPCENGNPETGQPFEFITCDRFYLNDGEESNILNDHGTVNGYILMNQNYHAKSGDKNDEIHFRVLFFADLKEVTKDEYGNVEYPGGYNGIYPPKCEIADYNTGGKVNIDWNKDTQRYGSITGKQKMTINGKKKKIEYTIENFDFTKDNNAKYDGDYDMIYVISGIFTVPKDYDGLVLSFANPNTSEENLKKIITGEELPAETLTGVFLGRYKSRKENLKA